MTGNSAREENAGGEDSGEGLGHQVVDPWGFFEELTVEQGARVEFRTGR
jgi:hypothetical protein